MESEINLLEAFAFIVFDKNRYFSVITFVAVYWRYQFRLINQSTGTVRISCTDEYTICQAKQCYRNGEMWSWTLQRYRFTLPLPVVFSPLSIRSVWLSESLCSASAVCWCYCYGSHASNAPLSNLHIYVLCLVLSCRVWYPFVCLFQDFISMSRLPLLFSILFVFIRRFIVGTSVWVIQTDSHTHKHAETNSNPRQRNRKHRRHWLLCTLAFSFPAK